MARTHRCRRSCPTMVPRHHAFCRDCWAKVPSRPKRLILKSWAHVQKDPDALYEHVELLMLAAEALEGDRPWESVEVVAA